MRSQMLRFGMALVALTALPLQATAQTPSLCRTRSSKHSIITRMPRLHSFDSSKPRHCERQGPGPTLSPSFKRARICGLSPRPRKASSPTSAPSNPRARPLPVGLQTFSVDLVNLSALADYLSAPDRTEAQNLKRKGPVVVWPLPWLGNSSRCLRPSRMQRSRRQAARGFRTHRRASRTAPQCRGWATPAM